MWSKQKEICTALLEHNRVAVKACHESSKSFTAGGLAAWWIAIHPPGEAMVVTTAPTFPQVRAILWREISRAHTRGGLPGHTNQTEWVIGRELVAFGRKPQDDNTDAFQGIHARYLLVVLDEACGCQSPIWEAAETLIANEGGKLLAIGNPTDPNTEFGAVCRPGSGYKVITISAFISPNFTGEAVSENLKRRLISRSWVEERKKRWGETSPRYISRVLGEFPETSDDSLISPRLVAEAVDRELEPEGPNELGVDVARSENRNETVCYHRHGPVARLKFAIHTRDTMKVCGLVVQAVMETGATRVKVDEIGVGSGVVDRLREMSRDPYLSPNPMKGVEVVAVNVGSAVIERPVDRARRSAASKAGLAHVSEKAQFLNLKAQLSWELRDLFVDGLIDLDDDEDTQAQIVEIRYEVLSTGKLKIESKEDVADRLKKLSGATGESGSPDRWDALVLAFADVEAARSTAVSPEAMEVIRRRLGGMASGRRIVV